MEGNVCRQEEDAESGKGLLVLASGGCFSRALGVAARLRIAEVLDGGSMSPQDIAGRTGSDPEVMLRLLQTLAMQGVFVREVNGWFRLAESSAALHSDHPRSVRNHCILLAETYDDAFAGLLQTLTNGRSGFENVFGMPLYEYLGQAPEAEQVFDAAMAELARPTAAAFAEQFDLSAAGRVIDVGGGNGTLLMSLLAHHPDLEGTCVDRPGVCTRAATRMAEVADHPLAGRLRFQPADIFEEVPEGGGVYLLKNVLHDWSPEQGTRILTAVRRAMARTRLGVRARLIVLEPLLGRESDGAHALYQMLLCGKQVRGFQTADDVWRLHTAAGLEPLSVTRLSDGHHAFESACPDGPLS
ncbi:methyltransferase [Streptomyces sp. NPDC058195]|uniref:methyltransferase n=1 Tax=Streptomyces sp. NPDC058195 TaxID=3346375 RepID=UPI0036E5A313